MCWTKCQALNKNKITNSSFWFPYSIDINSCTSQPDVCLVIQTPMNNMSKNKSSTSMTHITRALRAISPWRTIAEAGCCQDQHILWGTAKRKIANTPTSDYHLYLLRAHPLIWANTVRLLWRDRE